MTKSAENISRQKQRSTKAYLSQRCGDELQAPNFFSCCLIFFKFFFFASLVIWLGLKNAPQGLFHMNPLDMSFFAIAVACCSATQTSVSSSGGLRVVEDSAVAVTCFPEAFQGCGWCYIDPHQRLLLCLHFIFNQVLKLRFIWCGWAVWEREQTE